MKRHRQFKGWVYLSKAPDGRWNIMLPTFRTRKEALQYSAPSWYRLAHLKEM